MSKEAVFTMKLEPELRTEFMAETEAADRPASQVVRELMRANMSSGSARRGNTTSSCARRSRLPENRYVPERVDRTPRLKPISPRGVPATSPHFQ